MYAIKQPEPTTDQSSTDYSVNGKYKLQAVSLDATNTTSAFASGVEQIHYGAHTAFVGF